MPPSTPAPRHSSPELPPWIFTLIAVACGLVAANIYYCQPLVGPISRSIGITPKAAGLVVTMTQLGYAAGLLLLVPLGDLLENRKLIIADLLLAALVLGAASTVRTPTLFLTISLFSGLTATAAQILIPYAAHFAPPARRGRILGNIMSGLFLGIMSARPLASIVTDLWGWHAIYALSATAMFTLACVLAIFLPTRHPAAQLSYFALLASMARLLRTNLTLRRRALYQASQFGAFSLFWTTAPLYLAAPGFGFSQRGIALFAFIGIAGAVAAPLAGRAADRGLGRLATGCGLAAVGGSLLLLRCINGHTPAALGLMVATSILLDAGVSASLIIGQREIFGQNPEHRSRLNGLFFASIFSGGAIGSALGGWAYATGGWHLALELGLILPTCAFLYFFTERKPA